MKKKSGPKPGCPRAIEGGKRSGNRLLEERGREFFQAIGKKGGKATLKKYGPKHFAALGLKGGKATLDQYGKEHYQAAQAARKEQANVD